MATVAAVVASGFAVSSAFRVPGNTAALGVQAPSGSVGQTRIDFANASTGPWFTLLMPGVGSAYIVTSGALTCGVVTSVLGPYFRINASGNQVAAMTFGVFATRVN
jgi:hypothetical protein